MVEAVVRLGFVPELGEAIAKNLGSPKAIRRMNSYLSQVRPGSAELVVAEMLSICAEIDSWRKRKEAQEANARYNEMRYYGLVDNEDE